MAWKPEYITTDELAAFVGIPDDDDDTSLGYAVAAASRSIDHHCHSGGMRQFGKVAAPEQRFYTPRWSRQRGRWVCTVDDFQTATGLAVHLDSDGDGTFADAVSGAPVKLPLNASQTGFPWTRLVLPESLNYTLRGSEGEVAVTALWGWTSVPVAVKQAALLQGNRIFSRRKSPHGVTGSPQTGGELRLLAKVDPDVAVSLKDYRRIELAVA